MTPPLTQWFHKASEQGHAKAQFNLGSSYALGKGVLQDKNESEKWFRKAAEQGDKRSQDVLYELRAWFDS